MKKYTLSITDGVNYSDENKEAIDNFIQHCYDELGIEDVVFIYLVDDREKYGVKTTAYMVNAKNLIVIYAKGRLPIDVSRSIAHELVHKKQYEDNRIQHPVQDIGGEIEDEANAIAGQLIKKYIYNGNFNLF